MILSVTIRVTGLWRRFKKQPGRNHGVRHALTLEQQRAFVKYLESNTQFCRWVSLFKFLLGTGCRIGEAIGIRWEDVDFEKRVISVNHSLVYYSREFKEHPERIYLYEPFWECP